MTGKRLDMAKSCIRFKKLDDLALDLISEAIRRMPTKKHIAIDQAAIERPSSGVQSKQQAEEEPTNGAKAVKRPTKPTAAKGTK